LLSGKKSEGDSRYEEEDEGEEEDETNYTSSREVEKFFFAVKDHQPFWFKSTFKKKELTRKAVLEKIRLSKKNIHSFSPL